MATVENKVSRSRRRPGVALVYIILIMTAMMGFCSLAVDFGRVQVAKTELRRVADAAARAGAYQLMKGSSTSVVQYAATTMGNRNFVDGGAAGLTNSNINIGTWSNGSFSSGGGSQNAVQVKASMVIPLFWASIIGENACTVNVTSVAKFSIQTVSPFVYATGNPWLAGMPVGTQGSQPDPNYPASNHKYAYDYAGTAGGGGPYATAEPYASPVQVAITVTPGSVITVTNVSGNAQNDPSGPQHTADGNASGSMWYYDDAAANGVAEHGIADSTNPLDSMLGVFLTNAQPDTTAAPAALDFSTQAARDYTSLTPLNKQVFYIGTGQNSSGTQQEIVVPAGATRFFMGIQDGWEWNNNQGGFNTTITETSISIVQ